VLVENFFMKTLFTTIQKKGRCDRPLFLFCLALNFEKSVARFFEDDIKLKLEVIFLKSYTYLYASGNNQSKKQFTPRLFNRR